MENLTWLINLPPAAREAVGYVDFELFLSDSPRLPGDSAYMAGWKEAKQISITTQGNRNKWHQSVEAEAGESEKGD